MYTVLFSLMPRPPPRSTLFPYTTLFRSLAAGRWCRPCHRRRRGDLLAVAEFWRAPGLLGWSWNRFWCRRRGIFQCHAEEARAPTCARHDRRLADDFRRCAIARDGIFRGRKSAALTLDKNGTILPFLSRGAGFRPHLPAALLAVAAHVGHEPANHLADHAARRGALRLAAWRRDVLNLVARRWCARPRRSVVNFSQS